MFPKKSFLWAWSVLEEPAQALRAIVAKPLEDSIGKYLVLLVYSGLVAGIVSFGWAFLRGIYLDVVRDITIDYWRLLNYYGQVLMGTMFLYIFFGTFVLFVISLFVHRFAADARYIKVVAVTCASAAPLLVFGWVNYRVLLALLVWMFFLLVAGVRVLREDAAASARLKKQAVQQKTKRVQTKR